VQTRFERIRLVDSPIDDSADQGPDDDVSEGLRVVADGDLSTGRAVLDEFEKRVM
jgi:hypothetical protein